MNKMAIRLIANKYHEMKQRVRDEHAARLHSCDGDFLEWALCAARLAAPEAGERYDDPSVMNRACL